MKVKFIAFYILLVFLPMILFFQWYSKTLLQDRQSEIRYEKQQLLDQSVRMFNNQLLETETVSTALQSSPALIKLLQNKYASASDEIFSYLTDVLPTLTGITVSHPMIDSTFVYRYTDSALKDSSIDYYLVNVKDFGYDRKILDQVKQNYFVWFAEMDPYAARHDTSYSSKAPTSPKLICFSRIYDETYSKIVGIAELQVNMDRLMASMDFFLTGESLYLKIGKEYYPINFNTDRRVRYNEPLDSIPAASTGKYGLAVTDLGGSNMEFVYQYRDTDLGNPVLFQNLLKAVLLLIAPAILLLIYLYHFTARLSKFSNHIKRMHGENLVQYDGGASRDEFGVVIAEYNRMTKTISALIKSVYVAERQKNEANYYAMQSQVNPHFLFNTLENIRQHAEMRENKSVSDMLFALSRLLRYNISMRRESTLSSEIEHIRHYLLIYQYRRKNRISYSIELPDGFQDVNCPFCILQPIVENCFKHGIKSSEDAIHIAISVREEESGLVVQIRDNGAGMPHEKLESINRSLASDLDIETTSDFGSVGVKNVNSRLRIFYGEQYGISFSQNDPSGIVCVMRLGRLAQIDPPTVLNIVDEVDELKQKGRKKVK